MTSPLRAAALKLAIAMTTALKAAGQLVLPRQCAGCGLWDTDLCPQCRQLLSHSATLLNSDLLPATDLAIWSQGTYAGALRQIVLSLKVVATALSPVPYWLELTTRAA